MATTSNSVASLIDKFGLQTHSSSEKLTFLQNKIELSVTALITDQIWQEQKSLIKQILELRKNPKNLDSKEQRILSLLLLQITWAMHFVVRRNADADYNKELIVELLNDQLRSDSSEHEIIFLAHYVSSTFYRGYAADQEKLLLAQHHAQQAIEFAKRLGDPILQGHANNQLALIWRFDQVGKFLDAEHLLEHALTLAQDEKTIELDRSQLTASMLITTAEGNLYNRSLMNLSQVLVKQKKYDHAYQIGLTALQKIKQHQHTAINIAYATNIILEALGLKLKSASPDKAQMEEKISSATVNWQSTDQQLQEAISLYQSVFGSTTKDPNYLRILITASELYWQFSYHTGDKAYAEKSRVYADLVEQIIGEEQSLYQEIIVRLHALQEHLKLLPKEFRLK